MSVRIDFAHSPADFDNARKLFIDYAESLGFSLSFQGFEDELEHLPGKYAAPEGCILLAWDELDCVGCAGLGRLLAEKIVQLGIDKKYTRMQLDTLNSMQSAVGLYKSLGFVETDQYYNNPHPEVVFFELTLD